MTTSELCELFSKEISNSFDLSKDVIYQQLFEGTTDEMTEEEVYSHLILRSILISANLSAQVVINGLVTLDVIPKDLVSSLKLRPQLRLVPPLKDFDSSDSSGNQEE